MNLINLRALIAEFWFIYIYFKEKKYFISIQIISAQYKAKKSKNSNLVLTNFN